MPDSIFEIENLVCSYTGEVEDKVLEVQKLEIPKGKLVFLLGASGSGKSTLLETLGLMNDTIVEGEVNFYSPQSSIVNLSDLWLNGNADLLEATRKQYFSFIFQNTNLMDNFTAFENVSISQMIKENVSQAAAMEGVFPLLEDTHLTSLELDAETNATNLSVGQRQRLAFIRAINTDFSVLFGDEPTGNLDELNANELLNILKDNLGENRTAIIVSHDIDLAIEHADRIIVLTKDAKTSVGEILPEHVFDKSHWEAESKRIAFKELLVKLYDSDALEQTKKTLEEPPASKDKYFSNYFSLFLQKEGKALSGINFSNLFILTLIISLTLICIGFGNGGLRYLNKTMNNAFVKWLSINVPSGLAGEVEGIKLELSQNDRSSRFGYSKITSFVEHPLAFYRYNDEEYNHVSCRSIDISIGDNPLAGEILGEDNLIFGDKAFSGREDLSLVVTENFLNLFGYPQDAGFVDLRYFINDSLGGQFERVSVPVRAIVKEIPSYSSVAYSLNFYKEVTSGNLSTYNIKAHRFLRLFVEGDSLVAEQLIKEMTEIAQNNPYIHKLDPIFEDVGEHILSFKNGRDVEVTFFPPIEDTREIDKFWELLEDELEDNSAAITQRVFDYKFEAKKEGMLYDKISVYFDKLDRVRDFSNTLLYNYKELGISSPLQTDMSKIKEKENFNFLSKVTWLGLISILIFGIVSISIFVSNLLKMHLSKVKMNIGTFKAFGLADKEAERFYFLIVLRFLSYSILIALVVAMLVGTGINMYLVNFFNLESGVQYFRLFDLNTLWALVIMAAAGLIASQRIIKKMLSNTPGNLIYGR